MNFDIGVSSLRASQFAIETISHNLANANTEGYHRQTAIMASRGARLIPSSNPNGIYVGTGVDIAQIRSSRDAVLEDAYSNSIADLSAAKQKQTIENQIESLLKPGNNSIHATLGSFFDELSRLSANPSESVQRNAVIQQGIGIAEQTRNISTQLVDLKSFVKSQIELEVKDLNSNLGTLADLQKRISLAEGSGSTPNLLYAQRDQLVNRISETISVQRKTDGGLAYAGYAVAQGLEAIQFEAHDDADGKVGFRVKGTNANLNLHGGKLVTLAEAYNSTIDEFQQRIDRFATDLMRAVDQTHAQGVGLNGAYTNLRSSRSVGSVTAPLNQAGTKFPIAEGQLFISVTNPAGEKRTYEIAIDPSTDSLNDVASRISAIDNLQATVDPQTGEFAVIATAGFKFDFTGNQETVPDLASFTGTATPRFSGQFEGPVNRNVAVTMVGSGEIGKTPGLAAQVTDLATGSIIATLDIGENYEAGTEIGIGEGIQLTFSGGTVTAGDSFATKLIANSDSTGFLSAVGLNSFFSGNNAGNIAVSRRITENPREFSSSVSGDVSDTANINKILALRDSKLTHNNTLTLEDFLSETSSEIGFRVRNSNFLVDSLGDLSEQYKAQIASVSGVDLNEELVELQKYQKQYEAAVRVIQAMDAMLNELMNIVR